MTKDSLGDRMKTYYEERTRTYLPRRSDVIIRIDGCHFHTFTKKFEKPFDEIFIKAMQMTTQELCKNIQGCKLGYVQSDEISLWLTDYDRLETDAWFDNQVQKICSVAASMAAAYFNKFFVHTVDENLFKLESKRICTLLEAQDVGVYFDARCFTVPHAEVTNYFIWRQQDAMRNSVNSLAQSVFSHKELQGINVEDVKRKLADEGRSWYECSPVEKYGTCVKRVDHKWEIDLNTPIFQNERNYIEELFPID